MNRGAQQLSITVVPDSGTGELTGLSAQFHKYGDIILWTG